MTCEHGRIGAGPDGCDAPTGCAVTVWVEGIADEEQAEMLVDRMLANARAECHEAALADVLDIDGEPGSTVSATVVPE